MTMAYMMPFQHHVSVFPFIADRFMNCRIVFRYDFALVSR